MFRKRLISSLALLLCFTGTIAAASAAQVDCDSVYCFQTGDFSSEEGLAGICITALPRSDAGTLLLGSRVLRPGDILTADQAAQMTFQPLRTEEDTAAELEYLPIYKNHVAPCTAMTIAIRGKEDKAPVAEDMALETYKNLDLQGSLKVQDPEGQAMTYTVTRQPRRGTVTIAADGSFTYTPKKNKVGVDSFVYTATDPAGKVSREATVTVTILKPTDAKPYTDTIGSSCRFTAEWMKHTGIFAGENLAGNPCFNPEKEVTRGEFLTMLVKAMDLPAQDTANVEFIQESPSWLRPYLTAALRSGLTAGLPEQDSFGEDQVITGAEAAMLVYNALELAPAEAESVSTEDSVIPVWAQVPLKTLAQSGIHLDIQPLTRSQAADVLYQTVQLKTRIENRFAE